MKNKCLETFLIGDAAAIADAQGVGDEAPARTQPCDARRAARQVESLLLEIKRACGVWGRRSKRKNCRAWATQARRLAAGLDDLFSDPCPRL